MFSLLYYHLFCYYIWLFLSVYILWWTIFTSLLFYLNIPLLYLFFIMLCILREKVKFLLQLNLNLEFLDLCFICFLHVSFSAIITIIKKNQNLFSSLRTKKIAWEERLLPITPAKHIRRGLEIFEELRFDSESSMLGINKARGRERGRWDRWSICNQPEKINLHISPPAARLDSVLTEKRNWSSLSGWCALIVLGLILSLTFFLFLCLTRAICNCLCFRSEPSLPCSLSLSLSPNTLKYRSFSLKILHCQ